MLLQHTLTPTLQFPNGTVPTSLECTTGDWNVFAHQLSRHQVWQQNTQI